MKFLNLFLLTMFFALTVSAQVTTSDSIQIGKPGSSANKEIKFGAGRGAKPGIRYNTTNSKLEFSNDASIFKALGSGSGSGTGINLLTNPGFEDGISSNWTNSGGTYALATGSNILFELIGAAFTATAGGQYFESAAIAVPEVLKGSLCMVKINYKGADSNYYLTVLDSSNVELIPTTARAVLTTATSARAAKIYFTCPSSGSVKMRVQSTAAGAVGYFDQAVLGESDAKGVAAIGEWQSYTPTFVGLGTVTAISFKWRQVGSSIEVLGTFNNGTVTGATAYFNLPNNFVAALGIGTGVGQYGTQGGAGSGGVLVWNPADNKIYFGGSNWQVLQPGTNLATGGINTVQLTIPIQGLSLSEDSISAKCLNDVACENDFSMAITNSGTGANSENLDWINGNCSWGAGIWNCSFNSGVFSAQPICTATALFTASNSASANITTVGPTSIVVQVMNNNVASQLPFSLTCKKQSTDFKAKQNIQGFLSTMLSPVGFSARSSSGQSIPNSVATTLIMANENYDTHNAHDTSTGVFSVPEAGKYSCSCRYTFASFTPANQSLTAQIVKNGVLAAENFYTVGTTANTYSQQVTFNDALVTGDQIRCAAFQNTGSSRALAANTAFNEFSCNKVGN